MKINIAQYIIKLLQKDGTAHLPGIGVFHTNRKNASFSDDRSVIYPPVTVLRFDNKPVFDNDLVHFISEKEKISFVDASEAVSVFANNIKNKLKTENTIEITNLATLSKDDNGNIFLHEPTYYSDPYFGLPSVKVSPIMKKTSPGGENNSAMMSELKTEDPSWFPILAGILLCIVLIMIYDIFTGDRNLVESPMDETIEMEEAAMSEKNVLAYENIDSIVSEIKSGGNLENAGISGMPEECIIITASCKRASNVVKMVSKIEQAGYKSFTEQNGDFTRVGLVFNCSEKDLVAFIKEIRNTIEPKAWYLQPSLVVEYE